MQSFNICIQLETIIIMVAGWQIKPHQIVNYMANMPETIAENSSEEGKARLGPGMQSSSI